MGTATINGWTNMIAEGLDPVILLDPTNNRPVASEYLVLTPQADGDQIIGFEVPDESINWLFEVANGDPTQLLDMELIAGSFAQDPPEILLPAGFTKVTIAPGYAQRIAYIAGRGFFPLFAGTLA